MIEFVTLFLGSLFVGVRPVEVMVESSVVAVEIHLNGHSVARLEQPPWRAEINFGGELSPQLLEAVALGASGHEIDRTRQWINMSSHLVETKVMLEPGHNGIGAIARVSWESVSEQEEPTGLSVYFDGQSLDEKDPKAISLPAFDPDQPHHLRVELEFAGALSSTAEATFGGVFGEEVSTELTASVIELDKAKNPLTASDVEGWFLTGDEPLAVRAVEAGLAEIVMVRDVAAQSFLDQLEIDERSAMKSSRSAMTRIGPKLEPVRKTELKKDHVLRLIATCIADTARSESRFALFPGSAEIGPKSTSLVRALSEVRSEECFPEVQRLADAVALAGLTASNSGRRRAVVLISTRHPADRSNFRPGQVRRYLERLHVPFEVWMVDKGVTEAGPWGRAVDVSGTNRLGKAYGRLGKRLDRQRVVWLDGLHLPQSISLHPKVTGVRLVE